MPAELSQNFSIPDTLKVVPLKVELLGYVDDPEQIVAAAVRQCYSPVGAAELKKKISEERRAALISQVISSGHLSTLEHSAYVFAVEGLSRAASHQLVRHRMASYSQQSQRYVDLKGIFPIVEPPASIRNDPESLRSFYEVVALEFAVYNKFMERGVPAEDARFILSNCAETKLVLTMNGRSLLHFFETRLCKRAQWEIRKLAALAKSKVVPVSPNMFKGAGPTCFTQRICWEGKLACDIPGRVPGIEVRYRQRGEKDPFEEINDPG